jgi:hypothetical protein
MRLRSKARGKIEKENYSGMVRFFGGALLSSTGFSPCPPWLWGFFLWGSRERRREMMEVYASGFAEYQGGYFISCESALGVMIGWCTLMGIPNGRVFSLNAKGFSLNNVHGSRMRIFCGFYAEGQEFVRDQLR